MQRSVWHGMADRRDKVMVGLNLTDSCVRRDNLPNMYDRLVASLGDQWYKLYSYPGYTLFKK